MVRIIVSKFGRVDSNDLNFILNVMEECYNRLVPHSVSIVDLYVFERSSLAKSFIAAERRSMGILTSPFEEMFFATHDAWRGIPRIILCLDKLTALPELVKVGGLRHEVGHTIIHGELQYYLISFPTSLVQMVNDFNLPIEYARDILYLVSVAVKDCEVTRLLYEHGYIIDQVEYTRFLLRDYRDEALSWDISAGNNFLKALHLISLLKVVGCVAPLLKDKTFGSELKEDLKRYLSHLPESFSTIIMKIADESFTRLGYDTFQNIKDIMERCRVIFDILFKGGIS